MTQAVNPGGWCGVVNASQVARDEAARTAGADRRCTITAKAPARIIELL
ncbi:MAG: DUF6118 family protein [Xanthobacteraceae bacterium]|nr:DUF6118 family protein [Xanthobacteraceae bacterium]